MIKSNREGNMKFVKYSEIQGHSGIYDTIKNKKLLKMRNHEIINVKTIKLNEILKKNNAPKFINYIDIDVEGHELECLESIDFSSYEFGIIGVEIGPGVQEYHKIVNYLENFGYQPFFLLGPDTLFCHPDNLESSTKLY
tara:strand:+ start:734 stop:1150 length:417 start_codon:yes stop_codon:yes gene_type:complete